MVVRTVTEVAMAAVARSHQQVLAAAEVGAAGVGWEREAREAAETARRARVVKGEAAALVMDDLAEGSAEAAKIRPMGLEAGEVVAAEVVAAE
jgi:hypothetical protein